MGIHIQKLPQKWEKMVQNNDDTKRMVKGRTHPSTVELKKETHRLSLRKLWPHLNLSKSCFATSCNPVSSQIRLGVWTNQQSRSTQQRPPHMIAYMACHSWQDWLPRGMEEVEGTSLWFGKKEHRRAQPKNNLQRLSTKLLQRWMINGNSLKYYKPTTAIPCWETTALSNGLTQSVALGLQYETNLQRMYVRMIPRKRVPRWRLFTKPIRSSFRPVHRLGSHCCKSLMVRK